MPPSPRTPSDDGGGTNPYAAPRSIENVWPSPPGAWIKWIYAGDIAVMFFARGSLQTRHRPLIEVSRAIAIMLGPVLLLLPVALGVLWFGFAWSSIPDKHRPSLGFVRLTPLAAILALFVPLYGAYWAVAGQWQLCRAIAAASKHPAPWWPLPIVGAALFAVFYVGFAIVRNFSFGWLLFVSYLLGFLYLLLCDHSRSRIARTRTDRVEGPSAS